MPKKLSRQNRIRLVEYSSSKVSDPSEVCVCNWPPAVWDSEIPPHLKLCLLGC